MTAPTPGSEIGRARTRTEDLRFLTGRGRYVDDLILDGMVHAVILRSPHAHARVLRVDASDAAAGLGVLAVLTGADQVADNIGPLPPAERVNEHTGALFAFTRFFRDVGRFAAEGGSARRVGA